MVDLVDYRFIDDDYTRHGASRMIELFRTAVREHHGCRRLSTVRRTMSIVRPRRSRIEDRTCAGIPPEVPPSFANSFWPSFVSRSRTVTGRRCVDPRPRLTFGVTRRNTDAMRAGYPMVMGPPACSHCFGRSAGGTSKQSTTPWTATVACVVPDVAEISIVTGIFTCFGLWAGGTGISGGTSTCVV